MHAAPPVRMNLAPDRAWQVFVTLCTSVASANLAAWVALQTQAPTRIAALAALLAAGACAGLLALRWARRRDAVMGVLAWDGLGWHWSPGAAAPCPGDVRVMVDLGAWLLLRFAPMGGGQAVVWLATSRRHAGAAWPAWRAALYARRSGQGLPAAPDPA